MPRLPAIALSPGAAAVFLRVSLIRQTYPPPRKAQIKIKNDRAVTFITESAAVLGDYPVMPGTEDGFHPRFPESR